MAPDAIVVNGRFLKAQGSSATGVHRAARGLLDSTQALGVEMEVVAPLWVEDPRVDRHTWAPRGRWGERIWEQFLLPMHTRGRTLLSLANTAPIISRRNVVMLHDLAFRKGPQWFSSSGKMYGRVAFAATKGAQGVLVPSEQVSREVAATGLEHSKIFVVRPAIDPMFVPASPEAVSSVRATFGLRHQYILHVGWGDPRKDVGLLIEAHLRLAKKLPHDLVLVGVAHPNFAPVHILEAPTIRRLGAISDADLIPLLTSASALAFPSRYEGFGLPPLEAMACGTPAIVSDIPVLHESTDGSATFVATGAVDAWVKALERALAGELSLGTPPRWTWDDAAAQLVEALKALGCL